MTPTQTEKKNREVRPKPLIIMVLAVAFLGGPCTVQKMITSGDPPSETALATEIKERNKTNPAISTESIEKFATTIHSLLKEQARIASIIHPYNIAFGLLMVAAYSFTLIAAIRAYRFLPGSAHALSTASLLVLPAHVALAAVGFAEIRLVEPAFQAFAAAALVVNSTNIPSTQAEEMSKMATQGALAFQIAITVAIAVLFTTAWRYFQRPDVLEFFERKSPRTE